jgi:hypothetical protein
MLATAYCRRCRDEHRDEPCKLGTVTMHPDGAVTWDGHVSATIYPGPLPPGRAKKLRNSRVLSHLAIPDLELPDRLPVACRVHGPGWVSTSQLATATGIVFVQIEAAGH